MRVAVPKAGGIRTNSAHDRDSTTLQALTNELYSGHLEIVGPCMPQSIDNSRRWHVHLTPSGSAEQGYLERCRTEHVGGFA